MDPTDEKRCSALFDQGLLGYSNEEMLANVHRCQKRIKEIESPVGHYEKYRIICERGSMWKQEIDPSDLVTKELEALKMSESKYVTADVICTWVLQHNASPFGKSRVPMQVMQTYLAHEPLNIEQHRLISAKTYLVNRLHNVLTYFFGREKFHIGNLWNIFYHLYDNGEFQLYCVDSRKDNILEPKAGGTTCTIRRNYNFIVFIQEKTKF